MAETTPYMGGEWKNLGYAPYGVTFSVNTDSLGSYQTFLQKHTTSGGFATLHVSYDKLDDHKALVKEKAQSTPEYLDFVHRFMGDWVMSGKHLYAPSGGFLTDLPYEEVFPWPGWWDSILGMDQTMRLITGKTKKGALYNGAKVVMPGVLVFQYPTADWSDEAVSQGLQVVTTFKEALEKICGYCGKPAETSLGSGVQKLPFSKHFPVHPAAALPVCNLCYVLKTKT